MIDTLSETEYFLICQGFVYIDSLGPRWSLPDHQLSGLAPPPPTKGAWDYWRANVVNATNTYWSYGARSGCTKNLDVLKDDKGDGMRVYMPQPDGRLRWAAFQQRAPSTVASSLRLKKMVEDVGGNPANFRSRMAMAKYVIAREAPFGVFREEDEGEIFSGRSLVYRGQPASENFWGVGQLGNGTLTMTATTQGVMQKLSG
ncbi:hypothetical protein J4E91_000419 [Alternaria rosae]|nr:hypothetical protein J4E91_000419 [Alternaria rosae]